MRILVSILLFIIALLSYIRHLKIQAVLFVTIRGPMSFRLAMGLGGTPAGVAAAGQPPYSAGSSLRMYKIGRAHV